MRKYIINSCLQMLNYANRGSQRNFSKCPSLCTFNGELDRFNGITVDTAVEKCDETILNNKLQESLDKWRTEGRRCIWFKVYIQDSFMVPILAETGFNFHHARDSYVMMYKWLPTNSTPNLPPSSHTNLGVGAMVLNNKDQILTISEHHYSFPHWKLPGGYVEKDENLKAAAKREVKEETGVDAEYEALVTFRHQHNMMFGNCDIYVLMLMKAVNDTITMGQREVKACQWMDVKEFLEHPHVYQWNRTVVKQALHYKNRKLKLDIKNETVKLAQWTRHVNYLVIDDSSSNSK